MQTVENEWASRAGRTGEFLLCGENARKQEIRTDKKSCHQPARLEGLEQQARD